MKLSSLMDSKHVRAKNSNGTSVGTFSKFNLLRGRCTLLLSLPLFTSLCAPDSVDSMIYMACIIQKTMYKIKRGWFLQEALLQY